MEFVRMTAKQFREMLQPQKTNKYNAVKTEMGGVIFDSKKEANRYRELELLERAGKIKNLQRQVRFVLQEGFVANDGKYVRPISYIADCLYEKNGKKYVEDVKGDATKKIEVYRLKKKLFQYKYKDYIFVEFN